MGLEPTVQVTFELRVHVYNQVSYSTIVTLSGKFASESYTLVEQLLVGISVKLHV